MKGNRTENAPPKGKVNQTPGQPSERDAMIKESMREIERHLARISSLLNPPAKHVSRLTFKDVKKAALSCNK